MSMQSRATADELNDLHAHLAMQYKQALTYPWKDEQGNPTPPPAALLTSAANFLRNNGITGGEVKTKKAMDFLDEASKNAFAESLNAVADRLRKD